MAKIAARVLAEGDGWSVRDVVCSSGPQDRPFEEQHSVVGIAMVVAGTFHYRSSSGSALMTPGSMLLANSGQVFECGHEHGVGDRCLSFQYAQHVFEDLVGTASAFHSVHLPPLRSMSPFVARAFASAVTSTTADAWKDLATELAGAAIERSTGRDVARPKARAIGRVSRVVRAIERDADEPLDVGTLARATGLSPYHFLRVFQGVTGVTPHQYLLRTRLRRAAVRLASGPAKIIDIALDCGFGDVSNFNRTFRAEFGVSPRAFRRLRPTLPQPASGS
ncbi:MAG TPA: AraC family transcriptional regulator [Thermoanaerobaculia bacterium]|nr:AraC family transcriptional regulator [Thermoanaerobaculia bacterium]